MQGRVHHLLALGLGAAVAAWATPAWSLDDDREGTPRAEASDELEGQVLIRAGVELVGPVGSVAEDAAVDDVAASGIGAAGALGFGLSRHAELVLSGGYAQLGDPARCTPCGGSTVRAGVGLAYHLAQGIAMDPWARWGIGYRTTELDDEGASNRAARDLAAGRYHGVDVTQLALGITWNPASSFGFGPYVEMDLGTYLARPDGAGSRAAYAFFTAGFAIQLTPTRFGGGAVTPASASARASDRPSF